MLEYYRVTPDIPAALSPYSIDNRTLESESPDDAIHIYDTDAITDSL